MDYSKIPEELKVLRQWLCVKLVPNGNKKPRKVPMKDLRTPASVDDANTWVTFNEAVTAVAKSGGKLHHIGFVFTAGDPYCGVDLDDCVSDGVIIAEAQHTITEVNSYTETSISGTGIHIIARAEKPGKHCRKGKTEIYDNGRYFCFSGAVIGGRDLINERQDEIDRLYKSLWDESAKEKLAEQHIESTAFAGNNASAATVLAATAGESGLLHHLINHGFADSGVESASDADYILCCALAKATGGNADLMDAAMRLSALMRAKWDEMRGEKTYGKRTIDAALTKWTAIKDVPAVDDIKTHDKMAKLTIDRWIATLAAPPVNYAGRVWVCDKALWRSIDMDAVTNAVAQEWDGTLKKHGDYVAVRKRIYELIPKKEGAVFNAQGFAFRDLIATAGADGVRIEPLEPRHMASHCADYAPATLPTPLWDSFLARSFKGVAGQIPLLQELMGLTLIGEMHRLQQCIMLHGPGATGKSVVLNVITSLFPPDLTCAVAPADWNREYSRAEMIGKKLNVAGELSGVRSIQSDIFKAVVAGDKIGARRIYEGTFSLSVCAAHWFSANELPSTEDHTSGWYRRFAIIQMPNSVPLSERDTRLDQQLQGEKAGIAAWALDGAARYFLMGGLTVPVSEAGSETLIGPAMLDEWRAERDTVVAWRAAFPEVDVNDADAYKNYRAWCFNESGGNPCSLQRFRRRLKGL